MTSQEAQKRIDQYENAIVSAYTSLYSQAQATVLNVDKAASGYTSAATLLPLLISLMGKENGVLGAAWATVISQVLQACFTLWYFR